MQEAVISLFWLLTWAVQVLEILVLAHVVLSWIPINLGVVQQFINDIVGPLYEYVRPHVPKVGMLDLTPIFVIFGLDLVSIILYAIQKSILEIL
jgi:YggT family protein